MKNKKIIIGLIVIALIIVIIALVIIFRKNNNKEDINISTRDFEIIFNEKKDAGIKHIKSKVYTYNGDVIIKTEKAEYSLKDALSNGIITEDKIIEKTKEICENSFGWDDGGSMQYNCDSFIVIKYNTVSNNEDIYIGNIELNYSTGEK